MREMLRLVLQPISAGSPGRWAQVATLAHLSLRRGSLWLGYLEEYPDYMTQGESLEDLQDHLRDLYADLSGGHIPAVRKMAELEVA